MSALFTRTYYLVPGVSYKKYIYSVLRYQPCHSGFVVKKLFIKSSPLVPNRVLKNLHLSHTLKSQLNPQTHRTQPCGVIAKSLLSDSLSSFPKASKPAKAVYGFASAVENNALCILESQMAGRQLS